MLYIDQLQVTLPACYSQDTMLIVAHQQLGKQCIKFYAGCCAITMEKYLCKASGVLLLCGQPSLFSEGI